MKTCQFEELIDDYLFNRLDEARRDAFEEHYFNCPGCFEKVKQRDELIAVIKSRGDEIFQEVLAPAGSRPSWRKSIPAFLTPRQWAVAAVSAALILVVALGVIPNLKNKPPEFFVNEDLVRGSAITLITPVTDNLTRIPSEFRWESQGEDITYKIFIFHGEEILWSMETEENRVLLPEEIRERMSPGETYSWQVKAFSREGGLLSVSSKVPFSTIPSR